MARLQIVQELTWVPLKTSIASDETRFLRETALNTDRPNLGPAIAKRAEWLGLRFKDGSGGASISNAPASSSNESIRHSNPMDIGALMNPVPGASSAPSSIATMSTTTGSSAMSISVSSSANSSLTASSSMSNSNPSYGMGTPASSSSSGGHPAMALPKSSLNAFQQAQSNMQLVDQTVVQPAPNDAAAGIADEFERNCDSPFKPGVVGQTLESSRKLEPITSSASGIKADHLNDAFLGEIPYRLSHSLLHLKLPKDTIQSQAVKALGASFRRAILKADAVPSGVAKSYAGYITALDQDAMEDILTSQWCQICNDARDFLADAIHPSPPQTSPTASSSTASTSPDLLPVLFHNTSNKSAKRNNALSRDNTRPDIQVLERAQLPCTKAVEWGPNPKRPSTKVSVATQELKRYATQDLGRRVSAQVLRNMYKIFQHRKGLARTFHVTVAGPLVRLWMCDTSSVSTSRSYDVRRVEDAEPIAQILALLCSSVEQLVPAWRPYIGMILICKNPAVTPFANSDEELLPELRDRRVKIVEEPVFMPPYTAKLWGRHTACWFAVAIDLDDPLRKRFPLILKAGWLPTYLRPHEYSMLRIINAPDTSGASLSSNRNFPQPVGIVDLAAAPDPVPTPTARLPAIPRHHLESAEFDVQSELVVLAQDCERGLPVFDPAIFSEWTIQQHIRILRDLIRLLRLVSQKGIHYRDVNLGNFALKSNWKELLSGNDSVVILYDFGNSRYLDEPRGGRLSPRARGIPIGADDALSAHAMLVSHRSQQCREKLAEARDARAAAFRHADDADRARGFNEKAILFDTEAMRLCHRFVDDCESVILAHLVLLFWWCKNNRLSAASRALNIMCNSLGTLEGKAPLWCTQWDSKLTAVDGHLIVKGDRFIAQWRPLLCEMNKTIRECQESSAMPTRGVASPGELECFDQLDRLQELFLGGHKVTNESAEGQSSG